MKNELGALEAVPLREIWPHEERDFSAWLSNQDNLDLLSEELHVSLTFEATEKRVGPFEADIFATDDQGNTVVIENQFGRTDPGHLGKLLTYFRNLDAKAAIWITEDPRPEHERVVEWLNEITPDDVGFYLVKIEAFRIGDSKPAPKFTAVVEPSQEAKDYGTQKKNISELQNLRLEFWTQLLELANEKGLTTHEPVNPVKSYSLGVRVSRKPVFLQYTVWTWDWTFVELLLDAPDKELNKKMFDELYAKKDEVEQAFGGKLKWCRLDNERRSKVQYPIKTGGLRDKRENWPAIQDAMVEAMGRLARAITLHVEAFDKAKG